jgi:Tol biopolymer transport system component
VSGSTPASSNLAVISSTASATSGTLLTQNTSANLDSAEPSFSPDGSRIVFSSRTQLNGAWNGTTTYSNNIWVVDADGSDLTPLTQNSSIGGGLDSGLAPSGVWYVAP